MKNPHQATRDFEEALAEYTGAPYVVAVDSCSNAIALSLMYSNVAGKEITIPRATYMSVPCEIILAGAKVKFTEADKYNLLMPDGKIYLTGSYPLIGTNIYDSALDFTSDMYMPETLMCISFTGPNKRLKLGKGGAILTDNEKAYNWFKKARYSGRGECSYHVDNFDEDGIIGRNCYMLPMIAAQGLLLMPQFYNLDGTKKEFPPLSLPYPDLSKFNCYKK